MTPRRTLRVAYWEATRSVGSVDRHTGIAILLVLLALGGLAPVVVASNPTPGAGLYRVGIEHSSPYFPVVAETPELRAVDPQSEDLDLRIVGRTVLVRDTEAGRAAATVLHEAVAAYNDRLLSMASNRTAAFPVTVTLRYVEQSPLEIQPGPGGAGGAESGSETMPGTTRAGGRATTVQPTTGGSDRSGGDTAGTPTGATTERPARADTATDRTERTTAGTVPPASNGLGSSGPIAGLFGGGQTGTPSQITPPFPLDSLVLAFVFLLPFNFVIQAYGSSVIAERIDRRGEPLLVSPATRGDIVLGKALPYLLGSIGLTAVIAFALHASLLSVAAIVPIAALFIAATFLAGMLARSYKELTFSTVTISVVVTGFAFLPAVFTTVHPIAAISPLSIVVSDLQGNPVSLPTFLFATLPATLSAVVLFALGTGLYREEDLFTQRPLPQKALDALAAPLRSRWRVGLWTALFIPFVLVAELLAIAILYMLPVRLSVPILLAVVALVEELAKSLHVYAGFERDRFERRPGTALLLGGISGSGFFLAEKTLAITQLVGLPNLKIGRAAFAPEVLGFGPAVLLVAPLVLHTATAAVAALGASRSSRSYVGALLLAVMIHLGYNLAVVNSLA
ncbi:MAG: PrsW family intramembrane metalloprotease [Halodesulfurarchaeum sp.]